MVSSHTRVLQLDSSCRTCTSNSILKVLQRNLQSSAEPVHSFVARGSRKNWRTHVGSRWPPVARREPSLSHPAAFLILLNCHQKLHSTLATLCSARLMYATPMLASAFVLANFQCLSAVFELLRASSAVLSFFTNLSAYFTVSSFFMFAACLHHLLHHQPVHDTEIVFDDVFM